MGIVLGCCCDSLRDLLVGVVGGYRFFSTTEQNNTRKHTKPQQTEADQPNVLPTKRDIANKGVTESFVDTPSACFFTTVNARAARSTANESSWYFSDLLLLLLSTGVRSRLD